MSAPSDEAVRRLADREAIAGLVARYARAVDGRDAGGVAACFTPDGRFGSADGTVAVEGRAALVAFYADALADGPPSLHLMGNVAIELMGDTAAVQVDAAVHRWPAGGRVEVRGVTYRDRVRRVGGAWLMEERRHTLVGVGLT